MSTRLKLGARSEGVGAAIVRAGGVYAVVDIVFVLYIIWICS